MLHVAPAAAALPVGKPEVLPCPKQGAPRRWQGAHKGANAPTRMDTGQWGKRLSTAAVTPAGAGGRPGEVENRSRGARGGEGRGARTGRSAWQQSDSGSVLGGSWGCWGSSVGEKGEAAQAPSSAQNQGPPSLGLEEIDGARGSRGRGQKAPGCCASPPWHQAQATEACPAPPGPWTQPGPCISLQAIARPQAQ